MGCKFTTSTNATRSNVNNTIEDVTLKICDVLQFKEQSKEHIKLIIKETENEYQIKETQNEYINKQYFMKELVYNISKLLQSGPTLDTNTTTNNVKDNNNNDGNSNDDNKYDENVQSIETTLYSNLIGNSWNLSRVSIPSILGETNTPSEWWYYVGYVKDINNHEYSIQMQILRGALYNIIEYAGTILAIGDKNQNKYYYSFDPGLNDNFSDNFYAARANNNTYKIKFNNSNNYVTNFEYIGNASDDKNNVGYTGLLNAQYYLYSKGIDSYNNNNDILELNIYVKDERGTVYEGTNGLVGNSYELAQPGLKLLPNNPNNINNKSSIKIGNEQAVNLQSGNIWLDRQMQLQLPKGNGPLYVGNWMALFLNDDKFFSLAVFWNQVKLPDFQWKSGSMLNKKPIFSFGALYNKYDKAVSTLSMSNGGKYLRGYGNNKNFPPINKQIDFDINILNPKNANDSPHWQSSKSNNTYCTAWQILFNTIWDNPKTLYLFAMVDGCENSFGSNTAFWEGAVAIYKDINKKELFGYGFVEQMGYN